IQVSEASTSTLSKETGVGAPVDQTFGPHVREIVIAENGTTAVMNTMNWDHNLYAVDLDSGKLRWTQRVGHYFAFSPQALHSGITAQGFDFKTGEGYHLYLLDGKGAIERRFALYGVPNRLTHRFVPGILHDIMTGASVDNFAVPTDGSWVATAGDLGLVV